jgi:hypothetical protein
MISSNTHGIRDLTHKNWRNVGSELEGLHSFMGVITSLSKALNVMVTRKVHWTSQVLVKAGPADTHFPV